MKEYFQCDKCCKWNILPEDNGRRLEEIQEMEFCCADIGKKCQSLNDDGVEEEKSLNNQPNLVLKDSE